MKNNRNNLIVVIVLAVGLLCVWGALFYFVVIKARDIARMAQKTEQMENEERSVQEMKLSVEKDIISHQRIDDYFISSSTLISFIEELETLAQRTGASVNIESLDQNEKENTVSLGMIVRGSSASITRFVSALEISPRLIQIESITLARAVGKGSTEWGAKITGTMYAYEGQQ